MWRGSLIEKGTSRWLPWIVVGEDGAIPLKTHWEPRVEVGFPRRWMHSIFLKFKIKARHGSQAGEEKSLLMNT